MVNWGHRIKQLREERHFTQDELSELSGVTRTLISRIEMGDVQTYKEETLRGFSRAFQMTAGQLSQYLLGESKESPPLTDDTLISELRNRLNASEIIKLPVRGYINAGTPTTVEAIELGNAYVEREVISGVTKVSVLYCLKVSGDSLIGDGIEDGDTVVIDPTKDLVEGKIYVVKIGNEFVARHVHLEKEFAVLTSSNGKYSRMEVSELEVIGRIVLAFNPTYRVL
jgi:repressor LexA